MSEDKPVLWRWQNIIPILLLLATIGSGLYIRYVQKERKRIDFTLLGYAVIADLKSRPDEDLQLLYKGQPIPSAAIVSVRCVNSGNVDLQPVDAKNPADIRNPKITVSFPPDVQILSSNVSHVGDDKSTVLTERPPSSTNRVDFTIDLFNAKAEVRVDIIVANSAAGDLLDFSASGLGLRSRTVPPDRSLSDTLLFFGAFLALGYFTAYLFQSLLISVSTFVLDKTPYTGLIRDAPGIGGSLSDSDRERNISHLAHRFSTLLAWSIALGSVLWLI